MNTQVNPKLVLKYSTILSNDYISESNIVALRSFMNNKLRHDRETLYQFNEKASSFERKLEESHSKKGLDWLFKTQVNKKGELRTSQEVFLGTNELNILKDFSHFTLSGLYDAGNDNFPAYYPMYKCYDRQGNWFEYVASFKPFVSNIG